MTELIETFRHLARYNQTTNRTLYGVLVPLSLEEIKRDRGGFFGSMFGTMQHLMFGDHFILTRVRAIIGTSTPLDAMQLQWDFEPNRSYADDFAGLRALREQIDDAIVKFFDGLTAEMLAKEGRGPAGPM